MQRFSRKESMKNRAISSAGSEHPDYIGRVGESEEKRKLGRLAQLVQSIWFTPRGSGVRIPHRPPKRIVKTILFSLTKISSVGSGNPDAKREGRGSPKASLIIAHEK